MELNGYRKTSRNCAYSLQEEYAPFLSKSIGLQTFITGPAWRSFDGVETFECHPCPVWDDPLCPHRRAYSDHLHERRLAGQIWLKGITLHTTVCHSLGDRTVPGSAVVFDECLGYGVAAA